MQSREEEEEREEKLSSTCGAARSARPELTHCCRKIKRRPVWMESGNEKQREGGRRREEGDAGRREEGERRREEGGIHFAAEHPLKCET